MGVYSHTCTRYMHCTCLEVLPVLFANLNVPLNVSEGLKTRTKKPCHRRSSETRRRSFIRQNHRENTTRVGGGLILRLCVSVELITTFSVHLNSTSIFRILVFSSRICTSRYHPYQKEKTGIIRCSVQSASATPSLCQK